MHPPSRPNALRHRRRPAPTPQRLETRANEAGWRTERGPSKTNAEREPAVAIGQSVQAAERVSQWSVQN